MGALLAKADITDAFKVILISSCWLDTFWREGGNSSFTLQLDSLLGEDAIPTFCILCALWDLAEYLQTSSMIFLVIDFPNCVYSSALCAVLQDIRKL